jgi:hypothetical protein
VRTASNKGWILSSSFITGITTDNSFISGVAKVHRNSRAGK